MFAYKYIVLFIQVAHLKTYQIIILDKKNNEYFVNFYGFSPKFNNNNKLNEFISFFILIFSFFFAFDNFKKYILSGIRSKKELGE